MSPSGSVATTVPTNVPVALFSATLNVWLSTFGGSFAPVMVIVTLARSSSPALSAMLVGEEVRGGLADGQGVELAVGIVGVAAVGVEGQQRCEASVICLPTSAAASLTFETVSRVEHVGIGVVGHHARSGHRQSLVGVVAPVSSLASGGSFSPVIVIFTVAVSVSEPSVAW